MAASVSQLAQTCGAATDGCSRAAEVLKSISVSIGTGRATLSSMAAECLITQGVLRRLKAFLSPESQGDGIADYRNRDELRICFHALLQSISTTLEDVDIELQRLRRYFAQHDPLVQAKLVPILQGFLSEARSSLRKNRSSLSIIMDCVKR